MLLSVSGVEPSRTLIQTRRPQAPGPTAVAMKPPPMSFEAGVPPGPVMRDTYRRVPPFSKNPAAAFGR